MAGRGLLGSSHPYSFSQWPESTGPVASCLLCSISASDLLIPLQCLDHGDIDLATEPSVRAGIGLLGLAATLYGREEHVSNLSNRLSLGLR